MTHSAPAGGIPPDDTLRLLRLLARRGAAIARVASAAEVEEAELIVVTASGVAGHVCAETWRAALAEGMVCVTDSGAGRISDAGLAVLRRFRSRGGAPGDVGTRPLAGSLGMAEPTIVTEAAVARADDAPPGARGELPGVDLDESPLAWLARRRDKSGRPLIEAIEFDAGERFRADFHFAQLGPRVTANWSQDTPRGRTRRAGGPAPVELRDNVVAAQERVRRALAAVGPELAGVLIDVCGHLKGLAAAERGAGWPARSGKVVLQLALQALARHYGLKPRSAAGGCRHWGGDGYRPTADGGTTAKT